MSKEAKKRGCKKEEAPKANAQPKKAETKKKGK